MTQSEAAGEPTRRDFLYIATGMAGVVGAAAFAWPFIDQMRPDASTLALASIEVNVEAFEPGMSLTVKWRGKPVFIRNRTDEEVAEAQAVALATSRIRLRATPTLPTVRRSNRCTHLGCVPLGQAGDFGGWFCPCHGSHYDTAGRIRKGPAPKTFRFRRSPYGRHRHQNRLRGKTMSRIIRPISPQPVIGKWIDAPAAAADDV
jgi:ubiquinol-cytochrome c reductase iron-sulfur subunit